MPKTARVELRVPARARSRYRAAAVRRDLTLSEWRHLEERRLRIGDRDVLTAAIALVAPVITRNGRHFARVPGLRVVAAG